MNMNNEYEFVNGMNHYNYVARYRTNTIGISCSRLVTYRRARRSTRKHFVSFSSTRIVQVGT